MEMSDATLDSLSVRLRPDPPAPGTAIPPLPWFPLGCSCEYVAGPLGCLALACGTILDGSTTGREDRVVVGVVGAITLSRKVFRLSILVRMMCACMEGVTQYVIFCVVNL